MTANENSFLSEKDLRYDLASVIARTHDYGSDLAYSLMLGNGFGSNELDREQAKTFPLSPPFALSLLQAVFSIVGLLGYTNAD
jgi:hypothetical protein